MLTSYLTQTQRLLQNPAAPVSLYDPADLTVYINEARVQVAAESAAIRVQGTLAAANGNSGPYGFSLINLGVSTVTGVQGVLDIRALWYISGSGRLWIAPRSFDWFTIYNFNTATPSAGPPFEWAQYGQGVSGTIFLSPVPNQNYSVIGDCVCYPISLADDTTVEAIPPLWQTAVPYYAAYLALLSAQTGVRSAEADKMLQRYELFTVRARRFVTPDVMPAQYSQGILPAASQPSGQQGGVVG